MGPDADAGAVVDPQLRVRGITGLRVADASVMPVIPNAPLNATVLAIAEKAAGLITGRLTPAHALRPASPTPPAGFLPGKGEHRWPYPRRGTSSCAGTSRTATSTTSRPARGTGNPGTSSRSGSAATSTSSTSSSARVTVSIGLTFWWALVAITAGTLIGALLIALHATQGPRLGVPQSIQSRGQFGFYGSAFMFPAVLLLNVGFIAAELVIQAQAMTGVTAALTIPAVDRDPGRPLAW